VTLVARDVVLPGRLDGVSATLNAGSVTAICGPNGAGKSSLLQCLAGLLTPGAGEAALDGAAIASLLPRERARTLGYLPQVGEIAWDLSVEALVALGRLPHGDRAEVQVAASLAALDLTPLASRPVSTLSGGERARALLARVLAGEPRWILADEPLAALDIAHQLALVGHLRDAARNGTGVVLVLHDLALAMNHADRAIVLDRGRVVADGEPEESLAEPVIDKVWGVSARWFGRPGERALAATA
jgi:iron complex transport system ATP-binding protein